MLPLFCQKRKVRKVVFIDGQLKWPLLLNHCSPSTGTRQNGRPCAKSCSINSPTSFLIYPCGSLLTAVAQGPCWNVSGGPVAVCLFPKNLIQNCTTFSLGSTSFPSSFCSSMSLIGQPLSSNIVGIPESDFKRTSFA